MCAIIGIYAAGNLGSDFIRNLFLESSVRGLHATGLSYFKEGKIETISLPVPADEFPFPESMRDQDGSLKLIGHCRYSTSDREYNQPIATGKSSIVHNGVITQADPSTWEVDCDTRNDSELLVRCLESGESPFAKYPESSVAAVWMDNKGELLAFRNGKRPLYISEYQGATIVTSTRDIARRSGIEGSYLIEPGLFFNLKSKTVKVTKERLREDLQVCQGLPMVAS